MSYRCLLSIKKWHSWLTSSKADESSIIQQSFQTVTSWEIVVCSYQTVYLPSGLCFLGDDTMCYVFVSGFLMFVSRISSWYRQIFEDFRSTTTWPIDAYNE